MLLDVISGYLLLKVITTFISCTIVYALYLYLHICTYNEILPTSCGRSQDLIPFYNPIFLNWNILTVGDITLINAQESSESDVSVADAKSVYNFSYIISIISYRMVTISLQ